MTGQRRVRIVVLLGTLIAWGCAASAPLALAQEYGGSSGSLVVEVSGSLLSVSGDGFVPNSAVLVTLTRQDTGESIDLGALSCDAAGAVAGQVSLPDDLQPGRFLVSATGMGVDGSTRVLSSEVEVSGGAEGAGEPSGGLSAGAIAGIAIGAAALAAAGGWWLFVVWRRRRDR